MRTTQSLALFATLTLLACSPSPTPSNSDGSAEAGTQDSAATSETGADARPDAVADSGCDNFSGYVALAATCTSTLIPTIRGACVTQTGCNVTVASTGTTFTGTVSGNTMTFGTDFPTSYQCTATRGTDGAVTLECSVPAIGATCTGTGRVGDARNARNTCCDPNSATACATAGDQCTLVNGEGGDIVTACRPAAGTVAENMTCMRDSTTSTNLGRDNCAPGLLCAGFAGLNGGRVCSRLCTRTSNCMSGETCVNAGNVNPAGLCMSNCALFSDTCGAGSTCGIFAPPTDRTNESDATVCRRVGTGTVGTECFFDSECGANMGCFAASSAAPSRCAPLCDATHACPAGTTCLPGFLANSTRGFCGA